MYTHFPKDRNCEICKRTKITRAPCRRRNGEAVPRAVNFGDLITADHKVLSDNCESRNNHRYAVVDTAWELMLGLHDLFHNFAVPPAGGYMKCSPFLDVIVSFALSLRAWISDASNFPNSSMCATKISFPDSLRKQCVSEEYSW